MTEANLHVVRTKEEMLEYIYDLNHRIVAGADVPDSEITTAIRYQRDLNQHSLETKKPRASKSSTKKEPLKRLNLEDL